MTINLKKAVEESAKIMANNQLEAVILGPSGGGKSTLLGTFNTRTLYLYTLGENHGPKAAMTYGGKNILPICLDYVDGYQLNADQTYSRALEILTSNELEKAKIGAVAIDGATELELIIRETTRWKEMCKTAQGKHNGFAEPAATISLFRPILNNLKGLQREIGIHYAITCTLDVKDVGENGEIIDSNPRLFGYAVAESLVQQFGDILVVGRMVRDEEVKHKVQFLAGVSKVSKDEVGTVKRSINFNPRISGIAVNDLPNIIDADLERVIKLKKEKTLNN